MAGSITLALDAMGGDEAPRQVVRGMVIARERSPFVRYLLVGDEARIEPLLRKGTADYCEIRHTASAIGDSDKPSQALRRSAGTSMRLAIEAVRDGAAQGMVSAGNTGALMAIAKLVLKTLPGIDRPAIAGLFPTTRGESAMLDLGANVECDSRTLAQFAFMGAAFARAVLGLDRPTVALLNIGSEELKGNDAVRNAAVLLKQPDLPFVFAGYVEGTDIPAGTVDVVVTDGFTGNIALKTAEGTARLYSTFLRAAFGGSLLSRFAYLLARPALLAFRERVDPRVYNGAMFVGLNGIVVKSHGGSDAMGFANAIGVAVDMAKGNIGERIVNDFSRFGDLWAPRVDEAAAS